MTNPFQIYELVDRELERSSRALEGLPRWACRLSIAIGIAGGALACAVVNWGLGIGPDLPGLAGAIGMFFLIGLFPWSAARICRAAAAEIRHRMHLPPPPDDPAR